MTQSTTKPEIQNQDNNDALIAAAKKLLESAGVDTNDFDSALTALTVAKKQNPKKANTGKKNYVDKTAVYDDVDAFIYQRGDTKSGIWYFRIWDKRRQKAVFRSLKTTSKELALTTAKQLYRDIAGKIERNERLKQINTYELCDMWDTFLQSQISDIPHMGIVPKTYASKRYWINNWKEYIKELHLEKTPIDKIKPQLTRGFCTWLDAKPKQTSLQTGGRSREQINNNVNEIVKMYNQLAVRERYISKDDIPQIDRLKYEVDDSVKRDIMTLKEYETYYTYLKRNYCTKKHNPKVAPEELEKRKIFSEFILILSNSGLRPKELLGLKVKEVTELINKSDKDDELGNVVLTIRKDNSKTGKSRQCVAPVKKRLERIYAAYKKIGVIHEPEDYIFINAAYGRRTALGRMIMHQRLRKTLTDCGLQEIYDKENKRVSLYSMRHLYAFLRLIHKCPIHILAKNMGTSVEHIEKTYGKITTTLHSDVITAGMGSILKKTETSINTEEVR